MNEARELMIEQLQLMEALLSRQQGRQIDRYYATPEDREAYASHLDIFRAGSDFRERAAMGGNRVGKSHLGGYETSLHLTGEYPDWWPGFRFERPISAWACGVTLGAVRDICQDKLMGPPTAPGTGMIPREAIIDTRRKQGVPDLYDTVTVRHVSGGTSRLQLMAYAGGRESFQGRRIDFIWADEECDWPIFEEMLMRTTKTSEHEQSGKILLTLTPLKGLSDVAQHFLEDGRLRESDDRYAQLIGWDDVPHLDDTEKAELLRSIPKYQQDARIKGYPSLGSGAIYQYSEDRIVIEPRNIPAYFQRAYAIDVGWKATACIAIAIDPDIQEIFVTREYKRGEAMPDEHATAIRLIADNATGAIDPAARGRSQKDGVRLMDEYQKQGLRLELAVNTVEAGIYRIQQLMSTQRLHIFNTCTGLLSEMRQYQRDDTGKVIKRNDHLLDALRYAIMTESW